MESKNNKRVLEALQMQPLSEEEKAKRHILGRLFGPIATCTESTRNGRLYNRQLWEKALNDEVFKEKVQTKSLLLELGHPMDREETDMSQACACIPEVPKIIDNDLYAYVDILDTPNGRLLKTLVDYGFVPGISSRGSGDLLMNDVVDPETFFLETWDIVQLPAVKKARLNVCESFDPNKKNLKQALSESMSKENAQNRLLMKEALDNLRIILDDETSPISEELEDPIDMKGILNLMLDGGEFESELDSKIIIPIINKIKANRASNERFRAFSQDFWNASKTFFTRFLMNTLFKKYNLSKIDWGKDYQEIMDLFYPVVRDKIKAMAGEDFIESINNEGSVLDDGPLDEGIFDRKDKIKEDDILQAVKELEAMQDKDLEKANKVEDIFATAEANYENSKTTPKEVDDEVLRIFNEGIFDNLKSKLSNRKYSEEEILALGKETADVYYNDTKLCYEKLREFKEEYEKLIKEGKQNSPEAKQLLFRASKYKELAKMSEKNFSIAKALVSKKDIKGILNFYKISEDKLNPIEESLTEDVNDKLDNDAEDIAKLIDKLAAKKTKEEEKGNEFNPAVDTIKAIAGVNFETPTTDDTEIPVIDEIEKVEEEEPKKGLPLEDDENLQEDLAFLISLDNDELNESMLNEALGNVYARTAWRLNEIINSFPEDDDTELFINSWRKKAPKELDEASYEDKFNKQDGSRQFKNLWVEFLSAYKALHDYGLKLETDQKIVNYAHRLDDYLGLDPIYVQEEDYRGTEIKSTITLFSDKEKTKAISNASLKVAPVDNPEDVLTPSEDGTYNLRHGESYIASVEGFAPTTFVAHVNMEQNAKGEYEPNFDEIVSVDIVLEPTNGEDKSAQIDGRSIVEVYYNTKVDSRTGEPVYQTKRGHWIKDVNGVNIRVGKANIKEAPKSVEFEIYDGDERLEPEYKKLDDREVKTYALELGKSYIITNPDDKDIFKEKTFEKIRSDHYRIQVIIKPNFEKEKANELASNPNASLVTPYYSNKTATGAARGDVTKFELFDSKGAKVENAKQVFRRNVMDEVGENDYRPKRDENGNLVEKEVLASSNIYLFNLYPNQTYIVKAQGFNDESFIANEEKVRYEVLLTPINEKGEEPVETEKQESLTKVPKRLAKLIESDLKDTDLRKPSVEELGGADLDILTQIFWNHPEVKEEALEELGYDPEEKSSLITKEDAIKNIGKITDCILNGIEGLEEDEQAELLKTYNLESIEDFLDKNLEDEELTDNLVTHFMVLFPEIYEEPKEEAVDELTEDIEDAEVDFTVESPAIVPTEAIPFEEENVDEAGEEILTVLDVKNALNAFDENARINFAPLTINGNSYKITDLILDNTQDTNNDITVELGYVITDEVNDDVDLAVVEPTEEVNTGLITQPTEAEDFGAEEDEIYESFKESVRQNNALKKQVKDLEGKLSVSDSKEKKLTEDLERIKRVANTQSNDNSSDYQKQINELTEQLKLKNKQIKKLNNDKVQESSLQESLKQEQAKAKRLAEQLSVAQRESEENSNKLNEELKKTKKLVSDRTDIAKHFKAKYQEAIEDYVNSKARMLGVGTSEITKGLKEGYTIKDVDKACDALLESTMNVNRLPFGMTGGKTKAKFNESKNSIVKTTDYNDPNNGYEIDDFLYELAGLKK